MEISFNKLLIIFWCSTMTVISGFLVAEYQFFKNQTVELEQLKDDYANYIIALKKIVLENRPVLDGNKNEEVESQRDSKKK